MLEISIAAEKIASIGSFTITNSLLSTWIVMAILFFLSFFATRNMKMVPGGLQSIMEMIIGGFYDFYGQIIGKHIKSFFPLIMSFFMFIIIANWFGLLPGVGTIGFHETVHKTAVVAAPQTIAETKETNVHETATTEAQETAGTTAEKPETKFVPLLRGATADINMTLALALIAVCCMQYFGFKMSGIWYGQRFVDFSNPIKWFIGVLEIVSETSKIISFAFRLFGNIFAGEVLLSVMAFLMPFILPLPFLGLELFVGFIQALVFSMLVAVFLNVGVSEGEHLAHQHAHAGNHSK
jgi:F-type H+-transporting ATPase subunit a